MSRIERVSATPINTWLAPLLADTISEKRGIKLSRQDLRLTPDRVKVALPPREELERIRGRRAPVYATLVVALMPIPYPVPRRWRGLQPEPIPDSQRDRFATFLAEVISESTGVRMSRQEVNLIGENGKIALPPREEMEPMLKKGIAPFNTVLLISATPINIP
jgi:hypothetical protein